MLLDNIVHKNEAKSNKQKMREGFLYKQQKVFLTISQSLKEEIG